VSWDWGFHHNVKSLSFLVYLRNSFLRTRCSLVFYVSYLNAWMYLNNNQTYSHGWLSLRPFACNLIVSRLAKLFSYFVYLVKSHLIQYQGTKANRPTHPYQKIALLPTKNAHSHTNWSKYPLTWVNSRSVS